MFRAADTLNLIARFAREPDPTARRREPIPVSVEARHPAFDPDAEMGALTSVYSEISRRLSRNAYTSHTIAASR